MKTFETSAGGCDKGATTQNIHEYNFVYKDEYYIFSFLKFSINDMVTRKHGGRRKHT